MISHSGGGEKAAPFSLRSSAIRERERREVAPGENLGRKRKKKKKVDGAAKGTIHK